MINYFKNFKKYAFRLELLQKYDVYEEKDDFNNFLKTGKINVDLSEWSNIVKSAVLRNAVMNRVHVVRYPLSDYLRYEFLGYKYNLDFGENIFILDSKEYNNEINSDFWLFDDEILLELKYDFNGKYLGYTELKDNIQKYIDLKNELLNKAKRFN